MILTCAMLNTHDYDCIISSDLMVIEIALTQTFSLCIEMFSHNLTISYGTSFGGDPPNLHGTGCGCDIPSVHSTSFSDDSPNFHGTSRDCDIPSCSGDLP